MTNRMTTESAPKRALGVYSDHVANQYTLEFIDEKGDHIPMIDPRDEDVLESQLEAYFDATDQPRVAIWR